jgi:hypothetical protein
MNFQQFEALFHLWDNLHFTGIELQYRDNKSEIYATGTNHHTQSQLYICTVSGDTSTRVHLKQFRSWLHKINVGRAKRLLIIAENN